MAVQIEQFHTVVKRLATGPKNIMASIRNGYLRLVKTNFTRLTIDLEWVAEARRSTVSTHTYCTRNLTFH